MSSELDDIADEASPDSSLLFAATAIMAAERTQEALEEDEQARTLPRIETLVAELLRRECVKLTSNITLGTEVAAELEYPCVEFISELADNFERELPAAFEQVTQSAIEVMHPEFHRDSVTKVCAWFAAANLQEGLEAAEASRPVREAHARHLSTFAYGDPLQWLNPEAEVDLECGRFLRECDAVDASFYAEFRSQSIEGAMRKLLATREPVFYQIEDSVLCERLPVVVEGPVLHKRAEPREVERADDFILWFGRRLRGGTVLQVAGRTREEAVQTWGVLVALLLRLRDELKANGELGSQQARGLSAKSTS